MIYNTGTISINGNTATGTGTNWTAAASQIRVSQTIIVLSNPVQMFQITAINSGTSLTVTPAASPELSGQKYGILVTDSLSVDGLAQSMSQIINEYGENIGAWATFASISANQSITVTINGTSVTIPAIGGLARKGANSDITELKGLTTPLSLEQGGLGANNAADALANLGLPELLDTKFDKTGGTIKAISDAINIQTEWSKSGYFQISGEDGRTIHQLGKISSDNSLTLRNVAEGGTLTVSGDGARFNGRLLGFINEALNSGNGWWRDSSTGLLIQWGNTPAGSDTRQVNFPIPFKAWPHAVVHFDDGWYSGGGATWGAVNKSLTGFTGKTSVDLEGGAYIAIGF